MRAPLPTPVLTSREVLLGREPEPGKEKEPALRKGDLLHTALSQTGNADKFSKAQAPPASFQHLPWYVVGRS